jgi:hypothetical protein
MYIITARQMIYGMVLKYRNWLYFVMTEHLTSALPDLSWFLLTTHASGNTICALAR